MACDKRQQRLEKGLRTSSAHLRCSSDDILCDVHHVVVVSIGLIQLYRSELWIMPSADALIPENPPYFKDLLKAANNETLQMQLPATSPRVCSSMHLPSVLAHRSAA